MWAESPTDQLAVRVLKGDKGYYIGYESGWDGDLVTFEDYKDLDSFNGSYNKEDARKQLEKTATDMWYPSGAKEEINEILENS